MTEKINRRRLLKLACLSSTGFLSLGQSGQTTARDTEKTDSDHTNRPDGAVLTQQPILLPGSITGVRQYVEAKKPITHRFPWKTVEGENKESLYELKNNSEYVFSIDGKTIQESAGSWRCTQVYPQNITTTRDDPEEPYWRLAWDYTTPSKSLGWHSFTTTIYFEEPYVSKTGPNETKTWNGTYQHRGGYTVVPRVDE